MGAWKVRPGKRDSFSEIVFDAKPDDAIREELKAAGWRWHGPSSAWYGLTANMPNRYKAAATGSIESVEPTPASAPEPVQPPAAGGYPVSGLGDKALKELAKRSSESSVIGSIAGRSA